MPKPPNGVQPRIAVLALEAREGSRLAALLKRAGYDVSTARGVPELVALGPELAVLHDGASAKLSELAGAVRSQPEGRGLPLLCLCPSAAPKAVAAILDAGADDCLGRPFSDEVFTARVRALLRRRAWSEDAPATTIAAGPLSMSLLERTAELDGKALTLTRLEFELLAYLAARAGQAVTRAELLQAVWNYPMDVETRTLDKHVESLRRKLGAREALVETVRAVGYRLNAKG